MGQTGFINSSRVRPTKDQPRTLQHRLNCGRTRFFSARPSRRGELNRPHNSGPCTGKVLDSPPKSGTFNDFPEGEAGPKKAEQAPDNPEKPDRVRSVKKKPGPDKLEFDAGASMPGGRDRGVEDFGFWRASGCPAAETPPEGKPQPAFALPQAQSPRPEFRTELLRSATLRRIPSRRTCLPHRSRETGQTLQSNSYRTRRARPLSSHHP
jgi:hypothetical protein